MGQNLALGAIDIGGTKIAIGIVGMDGHVIVRTDFPTPQLPEPEDGIKKISMTLQSQMAATGILIQGIGLGVTGPVDPATGTLSSNSFLPKWSCANLFEGFSRYFDLPLSAENDADAAALGEGRWGTGKDISRFVYITIGTGIGGGVIYDGKLYRGVDGAHPELGHQIIEYGGPKCFCGATGCWESMASGPAMARWYHSQREFVDTSGKPVDAETICQLAKNGDDLAAQAVQREGLYLGIGIANLINTFTPDVIALGGGLVKSWDQFSDRAFGVVQQSCGLVPFEKTQIIKAALGYDSGLVGAACTWLHSFGD
jgi:glucokinase